MENAIIDKQKAILVRNEVFSLFMNNMGQIEIESKRFRLDLSIGLILLRSFDRTKVYRKGLMLIHFTKQEEEEEEEEDI
jgi:hypothetical protein